MLNVTQSLQGLNTTSSLNKEGKSLTANSSKTLSLEAKCLVRQKTVLDSEAKSLPVKLPESLEECVKQKISQLADEILSSERFKRLTEKGKKNKDVGKDVGKVMKKLSYHEKGRKNIQSFKDHIKEDSVENNILYSCKSCKLFPGTINKVLAERHAKSHDMPKMRSRDHKFIYQCSFCDENFKTKKDHVKHYQKEHCAEGLRTITCTKCLKSF